MPQTPLDIALERIEECRSTRSPALDLSNLFYQRGIPEQVFELTWLEKLDVSCEDYCRGGRVEKIPATIGQLTALTVFNCTCCGIIDLSPLRGLPTLQMLDCRSNHVSDLSPLRDLPALQTLNCWINHISDLSPLRDLPALQTLYCHFNQIIDLSPLRDLFALKTLGCGYNHISDLSPLRDLPALQTLDCSSNQIIDLSPLRDLSALKTLGCGYNHISDLSPLRDLPALQTLDCSSNQIIDLSPLRDLSALKTLDCSSNQISDLLPLRDLPALQTLDCRSNQISDLTPLRDLPALQTLDCRSNQIINPLPIQDLILSGQLTMLYLYGNPVCGIPSGLLDGNEYRSCEENLRNYWLDLAKGSEQQRQLKVQFVGNGRVGKTTLAYALEHKRAPSEPFKSTHGIVIKEIQQALDGEDEPVTLQLWDFGGQEIYHATHRLFLSDDCLYLLLWAEETEEYPDETRHPVSYWLESIHDLGKTSPVILVKNQIDRADRLPERPAELNEDLPGVSQIRFAVKVSAMKYRGMNGLRGAIQDVLAELKYRVCVELPASWLEVQRALTELHEQKTLPFAHFKQLCIKAGVGHAEWFVGYLHKTGALFYREGAFQDQIILDQNWAINAVYRAFDPNKPHRRRIERMGGRFSGEDASLFWAEADPKEQEVYVDFMRNCGICYEPKHQQNQRDHKPFAEREFIVPALLPLTSKAKSAWGDSRPDDWQLDIEYPFLHRSIIERVILRMGETHEGEPWRTGIFCHTDEGQLLLECEYMDRQQSTQGRLHFQLRGSQLERLVYALRKLVSETSPHRRYSEFLSKSGEERVLLPEFKDEEKERTSRLDDTRPVDKPVNLFISYSKEDEAYLKPLKTRLDGIKRTLPLSHWSDHQLQAGGLVHQDILRQLETADIVVLLVSPDFVATDYCFDIEMRKALQLYEEKKNIVIPIIIRETPDWTDYAIGDLTALPTKGKPLKKWDDPDDFWADVQKGIRACVAELSGKRK